MDVLFPDDENDRLTALYRCCILDTPADRRFDGITLIAQQLCNAPVAAISLVDSRRQWFKSIRGLALKETPRDAAFCSHTILREEPLIVPDATVDFRFRDSPLVTGDPGVRFYAGVPLTSPDGYALGALCVFDFEPRHLSSGQLSALEALAAQTAALINGGSEASAQQRRFEDSQRVARVGSWEYDVKTDRMVWSHEMYSLLGCEFRPEDLFAGSLFVNCHPDDEARHREIVSRAITDAEPYECDIRVLPPDGLMRWMHCRGTAERAIDGRVDKLIGTIQDVSERKQAEQRIKEYAAILEAQNLELERVNAELEALATTDSLTGLLNRRAFQERLAAVVAQSIADGSSLALILVDIDRFKEFNDTLGHLAGDDALKRVAMALEANVRATDYVARYGGEEFAVILPGADADAAIFVAERMRMAIEQGDWPGCGITASFGIALSGCHERIEEELVRIADEALYASKSAGRNRTTLSDFGEGRTLVNVPAVIS